jgi:tripartite-type tricarboxylate transporter receptor subunit TctC
LAALSKAKPGTLSYSAPAAPLQLFMENFNKERGADLVRVPFKGGGDAVNGVLSGATPITFLGVGNLITHLQSGTMTGLVVDSETRSPLYPDVPTLREVGYRGPVLVEVSVDVYDLPGYDPMAAVKHVWEKVSPAFV